MKKINNKIPVALIGGAFDPIHPGHFGIARFLLDDVGLFKQVWFVPCYKHLYGKKMAPALFRLVMCEEIALRDERIKICDYEIMNKLSGEAYHFVERIIKEDFIKNKYEFSYIIGLDNANNFHEWINYKLLEKLIPFIVVSRQGEKRDPKINWYLKEPHMFFDADNKIPRISSTQIRKDLRYNRKDTLKNFYDLGIADIIKKRNLYL